MQSSNIAMGVILRKVNVGVAENHLIPLNNRYRMWRGRVELPSKMLFVKLSDSNANRILECAIMMNFRPSLKRISTTKTSY